MEFLHENIFVFNLIGIRKENFVRDFLKVIVGLCRGGHQRKATINLLEQNIQTLHA